MTPTPVGKVVALLHVRENAAAPVGAGAWHGQKWSPEAKNEQASAILAAGAPILPCQAPAPTGAAAF